MTLRHTRDALKVLLFVGGERASVGSVAGYFEKTRYWAAGTLGLLVENGLLHVNETGVEALYESTFETELEMLRAYVEKCSA